jgi:hypothetical protein
MVPANSREWRFRLCMLNDGTKQKTSFTYSNGNMQKRFLKNQSNELHKQCNSYAE